MSISYYEVGGNNMTKTCIVLYLYDLLRKEGKFKLEDIETKFNCSKRTAARYMAELRKYFKLFDVPYKIEFSTKDSSFKLLIINNIEACQ